MTDKDIDRDLQEFMDGARELGMELHPVEARKKIVYLHAQAAEHGVSVDDIMRRNLIRELFGGGARP